MGAVKKERTYCNIKASNQLHELIKSSLLVKNMFFEQELHVVSMFVKTELLCKENPFLSHIFLLKYISSNKNMPSGSLIKII